MSGGDDPLWIQHHELPSLIADLCGLDTCPDKLLADVSEAVATKPDETLDVKFGLWNRGQLFREVPWTIWLVIDWRSWRARVRPEHAEDLSIGERDLCRTFDLVATRAAVREALAKVRQPLPGLVREASPMATRIDVAAVGESLQTFLDREVREDPFLQELTALAPWLLSSTPLEGLHPGDWSAITLEDRFPTEWPDAEKELPHRTFAADRRKALKWGFERAVLRIFVDFLDRWQRGDLELRGRRPDGVVEPVAPTWRCSRFMALHLRNGLFVRAPWRGQAPPADLPHYSDLTVWSVERQSPLLPAATPPEQATGRQDDPAPEASRALPLANDDQVHACIDALYAARKDVPGD